MCAIYIFYKEVKDINGRIVVKWALSNVKFPHLNHMYIYFILTKMIMGLRWNFLKWITMSDNCDLYDNICFVFTFLLRIEGIMFMDHVMNIFVSKSICTRFEKYLILNCIDSVPNITYYNIFKVCYFFFFLICCNNFCRLLV